MAVDPWDNDEGDEEGSSYPPIRIDREHPGTSRLGIKVAGISDPLEGDYGSYVLVSGELLYQVDAVGGKHDDPDAAPEVGTDVQFLVGYKAPEDGQSHLQEEIGKALKRAGVRAGGFVKVGDELHVKLIELQEKNSKGKRYPKGKEFGKHAVKVVRPAPDFPEGDDVPF